MSATVSLYHNPRCSKSREALALLRQHGVEPDLILYLKTPPDPQQIRGLLKQLDLPARALLRTAEPEFRELGLDDTTLAEERIIEAMARCPRLIQRPIAVADGRAVIGRPPEQVLQVLTL